jgi:hypothetical protein
VASLVALEEHWVASVMALEEHCGGELNGTGGALGWRA